MDSQTDSSPETSCSIKELQDEYQRGYDDGYEEAELQCQYYMDDYDTGYRTGYDDAEQEFTISGEDQNKLDAWDAIYAWIGDLENDLYWGKHIDNIRMRVMYIKQRMDYANG